MLLLAAFALQPALGQWTRHQTGESQATVSDGTLRTSSMRAGAAWFHQSRPYSLARPYSVEFDARITTADNHWVTLYSDGFLHLVVDWGKTIKHWQPGRPSGISA